MLRDAKYLLAYLTPLAAFAGIYWGGIWSLGSVYIGFLLIPLLEFFLPKSTKNLSPSEEDSKNTALFFDVLLYLNVPILFGIVWYFYETVALGSLTAFEQVGMTLNVGLLLGTMGINVAHELGHRQTWHAQFAAHALLLPNLYMHFNIEHNRGHHKHVATDEDPASARQGELFYTFWVRSVIGCYFNAWQLEAKRLNKTGQPIWGWHNQMLRFQITQAFYLLVIALVFHWSMLFFALALALVGFSLLESVNYIEHYGLRRKKLPSGRYEKVSPRHSWNSNHELGRIFLYELTRHADHHFKATRKFQILRHIDESPQLPYGYPASMIIALFPPLWFRLMDRQVEQWLAKA